MKEKKADTTTTTKTKTKRQSKRALRIIGTIIKRKRSVIFILLSVLIFLGILYRFRNLFVVAIVNNRPIWHLTLIRELEKQAGENILESMITKTLIFQEANKQQVLITEDEVNQELERLEENLTSQGMNLEQLLSAQRMTRNDLLEQIKIQKIVEKIAGKDIGVSDQEVDDYFEENKNLFPEESALDGTKETIRQQLEQQKLNQKAQEWFESLHERAKIHYLL